MAVLVSLVVFVAICCCRIWSLLVIPERAGILYSNEKYVYFEKFYVRRYSRQGNYYMNVEATTKQVWNNNVTVHLDFYEFLHNEYKRSFVEMHFKLCDMVNKDPYLGKALANSGMPCPLQQGHVSIRNITIPAGEFPNLWPFERCRVDVRLLLTATNELIGNIEAYLLFKNTDKKKGQDSAKKGR